VLETVSRAQAPLLGAAATDVQPDAQFTDLGGDSLSALTFANLLHEIFDVDVPVGAIVSPASGPAAIAAYVETQRGRPNPDYDAVHGRDATEVHASRADLDQVHGPENSSTAQSYPGQPRGSHRIAHRRNGIPGPLPGDGVARAIAPWSTPKSSAWSAPRMTQAARARSTGRSTAVTQICWSTTEPWRPSTSRCCRRQGRSDLGSTTHLAAAADTVDLIVDPAALVNHVLPYSQCSAERAGTAELTASR